MFYFLEGVDAAPLCRVCLKREELERAFAGPVSPDLQLAGWAQPRTPGGPNEPESVDNLSGGPRDLAETTREYFLEELDRVDRALERWPEEDPGALLARQLGLKARQELGAGRLREAVLCIGDLRRNLPYDEPPSATAAAVWDESVDELYDRVTARARQLRPRSSTRIAERARRAQRPVATESWSPTAEPTP
jgi:hypothetical protein